MQLTARIILIHLFLMQQARPEQSLLYRGYFPLMSDMSFMRPRAALKRDHFL